MPFKKVIPSIIFLISFVILLYTSYPSIGWWDSGFYAAASKDLGIPGPGGSILFILLGKIFSLLFFFISTAKAVTLVNIVSTSITAVFLYYALLILFRNLPVQADDRVKVSAAFLTALSLPFMYSVWIQSNVTRVYILGLLFTGIISFCTVKIWFSQDEAQKVRLFLLIVFLMGLDYTAHRLNSPFLPMILILLIFPLRKHLFSLKFWVAIIVLYFMGQSLHLYLLFRAQVHPPLDDGYTVTWTKLISWIKMEQYGQESNLFLLFNRRAPLWEYQIKYMYLRYFGWNFLGKGGLATFFYLSYLSIVPFILGCIGFIYSLLKRARVWALIFIVFLFYSIILVFYLNVEQGFHTIREIDRLFIPSYFVFLMWVGIGLYVLYSLILRSFKTNKLAKKIALISLIVVGFVVLPLNQIVSNWDECNKNRYYFPEDFAYNLLNSCEQDAILLTNGDNDTYPLWYLQYAEGVRRDVRVVNLSLLNLKDNIKRLRDQQPKVPISLSDEQLNELQVQPWLEKQQITIPVPKNKYIQIFDELKAIDSTLTYSDNPQLEFEVAPTLQGKGIRVQDLMILEILKTNQFERPIYFATTVYPMNLIGLDKYLSTVGIVRKLLPVKNIRILPEESEKLLTQVYQYRSFNNPDVKVDNGTANLYLNFRNISLMLTYHYLQRGNKEKAKEIYDFIQEKLPKWRFAEEQNEFLINLEKALQN
jgi:hypothetical protein